MQQGSVESARLYMQRLQVAALECDFKCPSCEAVIKDVFITDQFKNGIHEADIQIELFTKTELNTPDTVLLKTSRSAGNSYQTT